MEKILYYTVETDLVDTGGFGDVEYLNKIRVYSILDNKPVLLVTKTYNEEVFSIKKIRKLLTNLDDMGENVFTQEESEKVKLIQL